MIGLQRVIQLQNATAPILPPHVSFFEGNVGVITQLFTDRHELVKWAVAEGVLHDSAVTTRLVEIENGMVNAVSGSVVLDAVGKIGVWSSLIQSYDNIEELNSFATQHGISDDEEIVQKRAQLLVLENVKKGLKQKRKYQVGAGYTSAGPSKRSIPVSTASSIKGPIDKTDVVNKHRKV